MNTTAIVVEGFVLPEGVDVKSYSTYFKQTEYPEDTFVEDMVVVFNGHEVKILRYDEDDNMVFVCIGKKIKSLHARGVLGYMENCEELK